MSEEPSEDGAGLPLVGPPLARVIGARVELPGDGVSALLEIGVRPFGIG